jgi:hypothetical protein
MFEFMRPEPNYRRWGRGGFVLLVPLIFVALLLRGRAGTIYISPDPFWIGNYEPSALPSFAAEIVSYNYYVATAAALLLAFGGAMFARRTGGAPAQSRLVWYLPAFVGGIEAVRHAWLLGSRHSFTVAPSASEIRSEWVVASLASLSVVVVAVVLGRIFSEAARAKGPFPGTVLAVVLSVGVAWCAQMLVVWLVV